MDSKPNVIICLCDQPRAFDVGCHGSEHASTPNMDAFASRGGSVADDLCDRVLRWDRETRWLTAK